MDRTRIASEVITWYGRDDKIELYEDRDSDEEFPCQFKFGQDMSGQLVSNVCEYKYDTPEEFVRNWYVNRIFPSLESAESMYELIRQTKIPEIIVYELPRPEQQVIDNSEKSELGNIQQDISETVDNIKGLLQGDGVSGFAYLWTESHEIDTSSLPQDKKDRLYDFYEHLKSAKTRYYGLFDRVTVLESSDRYEPSQITQVVDGFIDGCDQFQELRQITGELGKKDVFVDSNTSPSETQASITVDNVNLATRDFWMTRYNIFYLERLKTELRHIRNS